MTSAFWYYSFSNMYVLDLTVGSKTTQIIFQAPDDSESVTGDGYGYTGWLTTSDTTALVNAVNTAAESYGTTVVNELEVNGKTSEEILTTSGSFPNIFFTFPVAECSVYGVQWGFNITYTSTGAVQAEVAGSSLLFKNDGVLTNTQISAIVTALQNAANALSETTVTATSTQQIITPTSVLSDPTPLSTQHTSASNISVSSTAFTAFSSFTVEAGVVYDLYVRIEYKGNQNAGAPVIGWHGGSLGALPAGYGYTAFDFAQNAVYLNTAPSDRTGPTLSTGGHIYETRHRFTAPSTGSYGIAGACSVSTDTWVMEGCDINLVPVGP